MTTPRPRKETNRQRSARNKAAHAERLRLAALGREIDPLDEPAMEPDRLALKPIPWNKLVLTAEQREAVCDAILDDYPRNEIARAMGTTVKTLRRLIKDDPILTDAVDCAKEAEEAELRDILMDNARAGSDVAALFLLKSRHGYIDRADQAKKGEPAVGGVLVVPSAVPLDEWEAAAARQQAQYRERQVEDPDGRAFERPERSSSGGVEPGIRLQRTRPDDL